MQRIVSTVSITLALLLLAPAAMAFSDVPASHPNHDAISWMTEQGIVEGYTDGSFKPDQSVNRAEFLKILMKAGTHPSGENNPITSFKDVPENAWYMSYLQSAQKEGYIAGYPDGTIRPDQAITFVEGAKILSLALFPESSSKAAPGVEWYLPSLRNISHEKIVPISISGLDQKLSRGEIAEMLYRSKTNRRDTLARVFDPEQQRLITEPMDIGFEYSMDDLHVYFKDKKIPDLDPNTVKVLSHYYIQDKNGSYFASEESNASNHTLDPSTFPLRKIEGADATSFKVISEEGGIFPHAKDKNHLYLGSHPLDFSETIDLATYEHVADDVYFKDKNHVYYQVSTEKPQIIKDADPKTFTYISKNYGKDKNHAYFLNLGANTQIKNADPKTFFSSGDDMGMYAKDAQKAYFRGEVIPGGDGKSFRATNLGQLFENSFDIPPYYEIAEDFLAIDKEHFYINSKMVGSGAYWPKVGAIEDEMYGKRVCDGTSTCQRYSYPDFGFRFITSAHYDETTSMYSEEVKQQYTITEKREGNTLRINSADEELLAFKKTPEESLEDAIKNLIRSEGNDPSNCEIIVENNWGRIDGNISASITLSNRVKFSPEEQQRINNTNAYEELFWSNGHEGIITGDKIIDLCYSKFGYDGERGTTSNFLYNPGRNKEAFVLEPPLWDPHFYQNIIFYPPVTE